MSSDTMKESEWLGVVEGIRARWPHADLPEATIEVWYQAVCDLPVEHVAAAVEVMYRDGREFPPNGGQIRQRVMALRDDAPQWGEVWRAIRKAQMKMPTLAGEPDHRDGWLRANDHDLAADFLEAIGWPAADEWLDDNLESRLRRKWEEWLRDRAEGRVLQGLPTAGLKRLERAESGKVRRLLPLRALRSLRPGASDSTDQPKGDTAA